MVWISQAGNLGGGQTSTAEWTHMLPSNGIYNGMGVQQTTVGSVNAPKMVIVQKGQKTTSSTTRTVGQSLFCVATCTSGTMRLYINNVLDIQRSLTAIVNGPATSNCSIGGETNNSAQPNGGR